MSRCPGSAILASDWIQARRYPSGGGVAVRLAAVPLGQVNQTHLDARVLRPKREKKLSARTNRPDSCSNSSRLRASGNAYGQRQRPSACVHFSRYCAWSLWRVWPAALKKSKEGSVWFRLPGRCTTAWAFRWRAWCRVGDMRSLKPLPLVAVALEDAAFRRPIFDFLIQWKLQTSV